MKTNEKAMELSEIKQKRSKPRRREGQEREGREKQRRERSLGGRLVH